MANKRYMVSVCVAPGIPGISAPREHATVSEAIDYLRDASIDHEFTSKTDAIRFAKAISHYFVKPDPAIRQGLTSMWCLVYTFPKDDKARRTWGDKARPFACIDPGAVVLWDRSSEIPEGFYGAPRVKRESVREAA